MTVVDCLMTLEDDPPKDSKEVTSSIGDEGTCTITDWVPQKFPRNIRSQPIAPYCTNI